LEKHGCLKNMDETNQISIFNVWLICPVFITECSIIQVMCVFRCMYFHT
jgi:hypothetical protein